MQNKLLVLILILSAVFCQLQAQDKLFTLDDVIYGGSNYMSHYPKTLHNLKWVKNEDSYSYTDGDKIIVVNAKSGKSKELINLDKINKNTQCSLKRLPNFQWTDKNEIAFDYNNCKYVINASSGKINYKIKYPKEAENIDFEPQHHRLVYSAENNIYIATPNQMRTIITNDQDTGIKNGQSYHRNEFGIKKGTFWSPAGTYLAYAHKDEKSVGNYPLINIESREATVEKIKYPMAGMTSEEVTIGLFNPATKKMQYLDTGTPTDQYLTNIAWSPNAATIYIAVLNREQNHMQLNTYDVATGHIKKTLFEEKKDTYVEPETPIAFIPGNDDMFIWQSERSGHNHIYLYDTNGQLIRQLTSGNWDVIDFQGFDEKGENIFVSTTENEVIGRCTYKINIKSGERTCLTPEKGTHRTLVSTSGNYILDNWSNTETPRKIDIINTNTLETRNILTADNPYTDYKLGETKIFTIKAADDKTDLYCRMITPPAYDPNKKYPVIVYVYGGPHDQLVKNRWMGGARMWQHYMAQKGYIAFTLDNRGSAGRGQDFEDVIHRQLGKVEMADQMKGIEYLKSLSFVDQDRIGVHGWSYGGFMTISLMTTYPDVFKVGVAGGPVCDWKYYEVMYGERYMDTPDENPEGYEECSLLNKADKLEGRLLIIHGCIDPTVVWQNSLQFIQKCIEDNKQVDYFVYPRHEHNVRGKDRVHLMNKVSIYFDDFL